MARGINQGAPEHAPLKTFPAKDAKVLAAETIAKTFAKTFVLVD
jgi:hypothetical protein